MVKRKTNKWMVAAFIIGILFLSCVVYISVSKYKQARDAEKAEVFDRGVWYGYQVAVEQLVKNSEGCNPVSVTLYNETVQFIDIECLSL